MMKIILSLIFVCSTTFAKDDTSFKDMVEAASPPCKQSVTYLLETQEAPCAGYLFSPAKEYQVRIKIQQSDVMKELVDKQSDVIDTMDKRLQNMQDYNQYLSEELQRKDSALYKFLYFGLGVLITGAIANNVN
jgi:hypothetical protein